MTCAADRAALVEHAKASIERGSKSFGQASKLFDPVTRERAWLLYAWCRYCDDVTDGQDHGGPMGAVDDPQTRLAFIETMTARALDGEMTGHPAFDGLALVASECNFPRAYPMDLVEGFRLDAAGWRPQSPADLIRYCYHVAGVVGRMMALVMGVGPDDAATLEAAEALGLAFQLGNIARDIAEDASAGRCYLPVEWLVEQGVAPDNIMAPAHLPALAQLTNRMADMAAVYEAKARIGARQLPFRCRWAVLAAAGIYGDIARTAARLGEAAWDQRITTSKRAKIGWVMKAFFQAI